MLELSKALQLTDIVLRYKQKNFSHIKYHSRLKKMALEGMWKAKMETKMMDRSDDLMQSLEISSVKTSS